jgi:hypothetical protein
MPPNDAKYTIEDVKGLIEKPYSNKALRRVNEDDQEFNQLP